MTRTDVYDIVNGLGGAVSSDPRGINWGPFRLAQGGGIAGNSNEFWITVPGNPDFNSMGPYKTKWALKGVLELYLIAKPEGAALVHFSKVVL